MKRDGVERVGQQRTTYCDVIMEQPPSVNNTNTLITEL